MTQTAELIISPKHYQAVCGIALVAVFLVQLEQDVNLSINGLFLFIGTVMILFRIRFSPLIVFLTVVAGQLHQQYVLYRFSNPDDRSFRFFDLADVLLCLGMLTYIVGHLRLHGLWFHVFPYDPRQAGKPDLRSPLTRSEESLTPAELIWLVIPIPLFAVAAEIFTRLLRQHWDLAGLPQRWRQFLVIAWFFLFVMFAAAHVFRYWRRLRMDRATAQLLLQDVLWHETRGEQRRINRWIVWRKLKRQEEIKDSV